MFGALLILEIISIASVHVALVAWFLRSLYRYSMRSNFAHGRHESLNPNEAFNDLFRDRFFEMEIRQAGNR